MPVEQALNPLSRKFDFVGEPLYVGYYATLGALTIAYPTGINGNFAIVNGTLYLWNGIAWSPDNTSGNVLTPVISVLETPPGSPTTGDRHIVGLVTGTTPTRVVSNGTPTGVFVGNSQDIAERNGASWIFTAPNNNDLLQVTNLSGAFFRFDGTQWVESTAPAWFVGGNPATSLFIGGTTTNQAVSLIVNNVEFLRATITGNVGLGITPVSKLHISTETGNTQFFNDSHGALNSSEISGRKTNGTRTTPTATLTNQEIVRFGGRGFDGTNFSAGARAYMAVVASQDYTNVAQGTKIFWNTTADNSLSTTTKMALLQNGFFVVGGTSGSGATMFTLINTSSTLAAISTWTMFALQTAVALRIQTSGGVKIFGVDANGWISNVSGTPTQSLHVSGGIRAEGLPAVNQAVTAVNNQGTFSTIELAGYDVTDATDIAELQDETNRTNQTYSGPVFLEAVQGQYYQGGQYLYLITGPSTSVRVPYSDAVITLRTTGTTYTVLTTDRIVGIDVASAFTVTLPPVYAGARFTISDFGDNAGAFNITINPDGTDTIMGTTSAVINQNGAGYTLIANGTDRRII